MCLTQVRLLLTDWHSEAGLLEYVRHWLADFQMRRMIPNWFSYKSVLTRQVIVVYLDKLGIGSCYGYRIINLFLHGNFLKHQFLCSICLTRYQYNTVLITVNLDESQYLAPQVLPLHSLFLQECLEHCLFYLCINYSKCFLKLYTHKFVMLLLFYWNSRSIVENWHLYVIGSSNPRIWCIFFSFFDLFLHVTQKSLGFLHLVHLLLALLAGTSYYFIVQWMAYLFLNCLFLVVFCNWFVHIDFVTSNIVNFSYLFSLIINRFGEICHVHNNVSSFVSSFPILLTFISLSCLLLHWLRPLVQCWIEVARARIALATFWTTFPSFFL